MNKNRSGYWSIKTAKETLTLLETSISGLSVKNASSRLLLNGKNILSSENKESLLLKFIQQLQNPLIGLLLCSAIVSLLLQQYSDAISITLAILIVVAVAFVQEYRSEQSLAELNKLVPHYCHVIRNGLQTILAIDVVVGDIVRFSTGDRIPADIRILECVDLDVDESSLTGETLPCRKVFIFNFRLA